MQKIPTLFVRDPANMKLVTREVTPGCEWVLAGDGIATRKWDGTNIRVTIAGGRPVMVEKRRNPTREEKAQGAEPGYVISDASDPADKHITSAVNQTDFSAWPDGAWSCEALGPKIQGGADGVGPCVIGFSLLDFLQAWGSQPDRSMIAGKRSFLTIQNAVAANDWEGIVYHAGDGRMAKIKRRDFDMNWPIR